MSITINGTTGIAGVDGTAAAPSVQGADSNTGVFFPAADTVAVSTAGSERVRIDSSGNVGIGTVSPGALLDINGNAFVRGSGAEGGEIAFFNPDRTITGMTVDVSSANVGRIFQTQNNSLLQLGQLVGTGGTVSLYTAAAERLRIAADGQIGIGGANYGTSGQVLTSGGSGAAPSWTSRGFASATLTDKTSVRANGTTYQNTTTGWLFVSVRDSNNGQAFTAGPSSASLNIFNTNIAPGTAIALVPPSYYYACSGSVLQSWYEGQA